MSTNRFIIRKYICTVFGCGYSKTTENEVSYSSSYFCVQELLRREDCDLLRLARFLHVHAYSCSLCRRSRILLWLFYHIHKCTEVTSYLGDCSLCLRCFPMLSFLNLFWFTCVSYMPNMWMRYCIRPNETVFGAM